MWTAKKKKTKRTCERDQRFGRRSRFRRKTRRLRLEFRGRKSAHQPPFLTRVSR